MDVGLSGKSAVVAGESRGCGRAISEVLAAEGATVVVNSPGAVPDSTTGRWRGFENSGPEQEES
jgi:3-oxoacyl-[acyl-carrier protein] reductase